MRKLLALSLLMLASVGCTKKPVVPEHPGAISNLDSYAYDLLLVEQDAINSAKASFLAGKLPAAAKDPLNTAVSQYNVTQAAWKAYHQAGGDATALQQALSALVAAVGQLQQILGKNAEMPVNPPVQPGPASGLWQPALVGGVS